MFLLSRLSNTELFRDEFCASKLKIVSRVINLLESLRNARQDCIDGKNSDSPASLPSACP